MNQNLIVPNLRKAGGREYLSLDGPWSFRIGPETLWRTANVPNPWQAEFSDLRQTSGRAVYRRCFTTPLGWQDRQIAVCFGAVSYFAEVSLNGEPIGEHEGGYLPFEIVLPPHLLQKESNTLDVFVTLPDGDDETYPEFPFAEIPHGKQSWYGPLGGIWQSVSLQARHPLHIVRQRIVASPESRTVTIEVDVSEPLDGLLQLDIEDAAGAIVTSAQAPFNGLCGRIETKLAQIAPWSPEEPNLYRAHLRLSCATKLCDSVAETFGFRSFVARDGRFYLNDEPFYLRGALDQDYYPEGICTPPSVAFLEDQLRKAKAMGLNCLRCHIKVPDPRYYEVADRLGMLIWTEIPNIETFSERGAARMRSTMEGILKRDFNHPSIMIWTLINEDWGTRLRESSLDRKWLLEMVDWLRQADPTRLVVDNSPCAPNYHIKTDINDYHYYRSLPERRDEWDALTDAFADRPDWAFTPHGDGEQTGKEPLVVSEFGVWGLPDTRKLLQADGSEPWWFQSGYCWGDGVAVPQGLEARFDSLRLDRVFGSFDAFIEAAQWYQFENLRYQIESIRARAPISGYVITELTDVHWEANGLMDMQRNPRVFKERIAAINRDVLIVPLPTRWSCWDGEALNVTITLAAGARVIPAGSTLCWQWDEGGTEYSMPLEAVAAFAVSAKLPIKTAPRLNANKARMAQLYFRLLGPDNTQIAANQLSIALHPRWQVSRAQPSVGSDDPLLQQRLEALGYKVVPAAEADVRLTRSLDAQCVESIRLGAHVLLLADGDNIVNASLRSDPPPREPPYLPIVDDTLGVPSTPYFYFPGIDLVSRENTIWRGNWITNFSWLKRNGPYAALPGDGMLDQTFDRVVPRAVMTGFRPWEFDKRVQAGVIVGWAHKPAATICEKHLGNGGLVATTFRLTEDLAGADPTATVLLDALIRHASGVSLNN